MSVRDIINADVDCLAKLSGFSVKGAQSFVDTMDGKLNV